MGQTMLGLEELDDLAVLFGANQQVKSMKMGPEPAGFERDGSFEQVD